MPDLSPTYLVNFSNQQKSEPESMKLNLTQARKNQARPTFSELQ
jgi:hypothetical protein